MKTLEVMNAVGCDLEKAIKLQSLAMQAKEQCGISSEQAFNMLIDAIRKMPGAKKDRKGQ